MLEHQTLESTFLKTGPTVKFQTAYLFAYKILVSAFPLPFIQPSFQACTAALKATRAIQPPGTSQSKTSFWQSQTQDTRTKCQN